MKIEEPAAAPRKASVSVVFSFYQALSSVQPQMRQFEYAWCGSGNESMKLGSY
jgi:hypothetical protein